MHTEKLSSNLQTVVAALHKSMRKQFMNTSTFSLTELETIKHLMINTSLLPTELAALTRITTQSMSQILKKLEKYKLIERKRSEADKRKVYISLTLAGKKMINKSKDERDAWLEERIDQALTVDEKKLLEQTLPVLYKIIEKN